MTCRVTPEEIARSIDPARFPAILTPDQAASLLQIGKNTLYRKVSEGCFASAVRRGKPLRFWRDRLIAIFLSGSSAPAPPVERSRSAGNRSQSA
jgi:excisionase family DNA binding protein